ncbi:hypothetical protein GW17_00052778, partial [Ensete ventricosum]
ALTLSFTLLRRRRRCPYASGGAARYGRQPPCQGAATPAAGAAAPSGGSPLRARRGQPLAGWPLVVTTCGCPAGSLLRVGRWRPSLSGAPLAAAPASWPQSTAPVGGRPLQAIAPAGDRPLQVAGSPLIGGP